MSPRILLAFTFLFVSGCRGSDSDCTCDVELGGERRELVCGERACSVSTQVTCAEDGAPVFDEGCDVEPGHPDAGAPAPEPQPTTPQPDLRCDELSRFCETSCRAPAAVAFDCRNAAANAIPDACAAWSLGSGALCRP